MKTLHLEKLDIKGFRCVRLAAPRSNEAKSETISISKINVSSRINSLFKFAIYRFFFEGSLTDKVYLDRLF